MYLANLLTPSCISNKMWITVYQRNESKKLKMVRKTIYNQNPNDQSSYILKKTFETLKYSLIIC